eukprot:CAMPEP_0194249970 /NCGR_PEP_ID=MMETSP0158-20130606/21850_1 /TAXON_ID=33649 /ORGANISM="Thalassionema nitzschioides, Strain L26-B" /LENGTH=519 /DNA_ID=CAMNT_0038986633 /DNA_START=42 /DNA_END=1601 /DNA_ORIENTATION=-
MTKDNDTTNYKSIVLEGRILRKKKRYDYFVLAVKEDDSNGEATYMNYKSKDVYVHCKQFETELEFCYLEAIIRVKCREGEKEGLLLLTPGRQDNSAPVYYATGMDLVYCAPNPIAIQYVMAGVLDGRFEEWTLPVPKSNLVSISQLESPREKRLEVAKVVRQLKGESQVERDPRQRKPRVKLCDLELLEAVEERSGVVLETEYDDAPWILQTIIHCEEVIGSAENKKSSESIIDVVSDLNLLNLPDSVKEEESTSMSHSCPCSCVDNTTTTTKKTQTRIGYMMKKKQPQIQWMLDRIQRLSSNMPHSKNNIKHIVDVGGGRGDLGIAMALAFDVHVTIVDLNESSLRAGQECAEKVGVADHMSFVHANFYDFVQKYNNARSNDDPIQTVLPKVDLVVALHACGDLSDLALSFATETLCRCPFLICPCCYTKRFFSSPPNDFTPSWYRHWQTPEERQVISRLAELNDLPHVRDRAIRIINSMRIVECRNDDEDDDWSSSFRLEEYENKLSLRNVVLVGDR